MLLIKHELLECQLVNLGYPQGEAHTIASKAYDYPNESRHYYESMLTLEQLKQRINNQNKRKFEQEEFDL